MITLFASDNASSATTTSSATAASGRRASSSAAYARSIAYEESYSGGEGSSMFPSLHYGDLAKG